MVVVVGRRERLEQRFESVVLAGRVPNPPGVENEEARRPDIHLWRRPREDCSELWPKLRALG